ncbi:hypothetical protein EVAR_16369_1 [Eumeta japonica]|uniref:Uncharacterized protein n=1 Tax=Eumeta variegata TaxID=151549 RepID=A0A4C1VU82_EUMVA|nr:hypothetical protein EVAR_16369_1 [Eumeta japonica]
MNLYGMLTSQWVKVDTPQKNCIQWVTESGNPASGRPGYSRRLIEIKIRQFLIPPSPSLIVGKAERRKAGDQRPGSLYSRQPRPAPPSPLGPRNIVLSTESEELFFLPQLT